MSQRNTVFKGDLYDCLMHYGKTLPKGKKAPGAREALVKATGVCDSTVREWLRGAAKPVGLRYFQTTVFLYDLGYDVSAMRIPQGLARVMFRMLGYGVVNPEAAQLGMRFEAVNSLFEYARGGRPISLHKERYTRGFIEHALALVSPELRSKIMSPEPLPLPVGPQPIEQPSVYTNMTAQQVLLQMLRSMIVGILPLAEVALGDDITQADRRWLRDNIPNDGLVRLSQVLAGLCSEKSREALKK